MRPDDLIYFTASKGYKAGAAPTLGASEYIQYKPVTQESVLAYELGVKTQWFDRKLQLDATVFHYDYTDKQVLGRIIDPIGVYGAEQALTSIPKSIENGAELTASWLAIKGLTLSAAATYLKSEVTSNFLNFSPYTTGTTDMVNFKGESFPFTPKWSLNYSARYDWDLNDRFGAFVSANGSYQTQTQAAFGGAENGGPPLTIESYGLLDLSAGIVTTDGKWEVDAWGKNVLNRYYWTSVVYVDDTTARYAGLPMTFGLTAHYRY